MKRKIARISGLLLIILSLLAMMLPAVPVGAAAVPTVTAVAPASGTYLGGTVVTLTGTNFNNANVTAVKFGANNAASFTINSGTKITAVTPAGTGVVNVTATNPSGTGTKANGFTYLSPPTVTGISPVAGSATGGTAVTISGSNFTGATAVQFGGTDATNFSASSATQITATAPAGSEGAVDVTVTTPIGTSATSSADQYTYVAASLVDLAILPDSQVLNVGDAFDVTVEARCGTQPTDGMDIYLNFDPAALEVTGATPGITQGTILSPAAWDNVAGTFSFSAGTLTPPDPHGTFTVVTVHFNVWSLPAQINFDPTTIVDMAGGNITGTITGAVILPNPPAIDSIDPISGTIAGGTAVTIIGSLFTGATDVSFDGIPATDVVVLDDNDITATTPAHAAGLVDVTVTTIGGIGTLAEGFTYEAPAMQTVSFDANGGSGAMLDQTNNVPTALTFNTFTRSGYSFSGWNTVAGGGGTAYADGALYGFSASVTLYAQWTALPLHTVTFNGNGETGGTMASQTNNVAAPLTLNTFTRLGYSFSGWNTTAGGTGTAYADGASYAFITDATMYAQWTALPMKTVTFDANGGSGSMTAQQANIPTNLNFNTFTWAGHSFSGWNTATDGSGTAYANGASYAFAVDVTLYAQWAVTSHTVIFNSNSGTGSMANQTASVPTALTLNNFTKAGNTFKNWNTAAGGSGTAYANGATYSFAADVTLYAQWTANPVVVSCNKPSGSAAGGEVVTITGQNFAGTTTVTFGGNAATNVSVVSTTSITCKAPAHASGVVAVVVTCNGIASAPVNAYTYGPTINTITPNSGSALGGTVVTITGGLLGGPVGTVTFGGDNATAVSATGSPPSYVCTTPAHAAGVVDVTLTNGSGTYTKVGGFTYTTPTPKITSIVPNLGGPDGGTIVVINGDNFTGATAVSFDSIAATYTVNSNIKITATSPAHALGAVDVAVTTAYGTATMTSGFTYSLVIGVSSVSPSAGPVAGGTAVTISGANFVSGATVTIGGSVASSVFVDASHMTATTPAHTAGAVDVTVTNPDLTSSTLIGGFTYYGAPTVLSIAPVSGSTAGGTLVTIIGTSFYSPATVTIGGNPATGVIVDNATRIRATTPTGTAGVADVTVTTNSGTATLLSGFTYVQAPVITSVTPNYGPLAGGTAITITGMGFTGATQVTHQGPVASFSVVNDTTITAVTGAEPGPGAKDVKVTTPIGTGTLVGGFTFYAPISVTGILPASGPTSGGTSVTISGSGFTAGLKVYINGIECTSIVYVPGAPTTPPAPPNPGTITAITPAGTAGAKDVVVGLPGLLSAPLTGGFTYKVYTVTFDSNGGTGSMANQTGVAPAALTLNTFTKAANAFSGWNTAADGGGSAYADGATYAFAADVTLYAQWTTVPLPTLDPASGFVEGGTVTFTGTNFESGMTVTFDGFPVTVTNVTATTFDYVTPAHAAGSVDVVVVTSGGEASNVFTYTTGNPTVPEMPAGMLFGTGIIGLGLFIMFRRMKTANATN